MTIYDYECGRKISEGDPSFYALIQAAMRKADDMNSIKLKREWPEVWDELQRRYDAPGGHLEEDDHPPTIRIREMTADETGALIMEVEEFAKDG